MLRKLFTHLRIFAGGDGFVFQKRPHLRLQKGFTLTELLVIIAVIAIIASIGSASFNSQLPKYRLRGDARSLSSSLMLARMKATSSGLQYALEVDLDVNPPTYVLQQGNANSGSSVWGDQGASKQLSPTVTIAELQNDGGTHTSGTHRIVFNPNGSSGTGRIDLGTASRGYRILLTPATGRIQTIKGWS